MPNDQPPSLQRDFMNGMHATLFLASCFAAINELHVRKGSTAGTRYAKRTQAGIGILFLPWLAVFLTPPTPSTGIWVVLHAAFLFGMGVLNTIRRTFRKYPVHNWYIGDPLIGGSNTRWGETVLGILIAAAWSLVCPGIALLHVIATISSRLMLTNMELRDRRIVENMHDSRLDAEYYASRMRGDR